MEKEHQIVIFNMHSGGKDMVYIHLRSFLWQHIPFSRHHSQPGCSLEAARIKFSSSRHDQEPHEDKHRPPAKAVNASVSKQLFKWPTDTRFAVRMHSCITANVQRGEVSNTRWGTACGWTRKRGWRLVQMERRRQPCVCALNSIWDYMALETYLLNVDTNVHDSTCIHVHKGLHLALLNESEKRHFLDFNPNP